MSIYSVAGGPSYIRLNQSSVKDKTKTKKKIQHQHTTIMDKLASDLHRRHGLPTKSTILKKFSEQLETMFDQSSQVLSLGLLSCHLPGQRLSQIGIHHCPRQLCELL